MFDTKKFGAYIARNRKNADMTQSNLAEKVGLTRQAISKYETGDSFPDVSILIRIAELFDITLDELIHSGSPSPGEAKILKNIADTSKETMLVNINDIVNLAPLIKPSILGAFTKKMGMQGIDISHITTLVQYLNDDNVLHLLQSAKYDTLNEELTEKLIPFLDNMAKEVILKKIIEGESDWRILSVMFPYIEDMSRQLDAAIVDGALPKEALDMINEYYYRKMGL